MQSSDLSQGADRKRGVRPLSSVLKALAVLDVIGGADRPLRLADLARAVGESRATTYQKLVTLVAAGWIEPTGEGAYRLSLHAARMGEAALAQADLGERSRAVLEALVAEVGETASLAVIRGTQVQLVQRVEAEVAVSVRTPVGALLSLDQSASGRVLTAFASLAERATLVKKGGVLASEAVLREVRRTGHATSSGKDVPGVKSAAVPVLDDAECCVYALSIVAPVTRFDAQRYLHPLAQAAARLGARAG